VYTEAGHSVPGIFFGMGLMALFGIVLGILYLVQLVWVPVIAGRRGRDAGLWFLVTFVWVSSNAGLVFVAPWVPLMAFAGKQAFTITLVVFFAAVLFSFLPLFIASRYPPGTRPERRYPRARFRSGRAVTRFRRRY
jgi:hypothetical protein